MVRNPYHPLFLGSASGEHPLWCPEHPVLPQHQCSQGCLSQFFFFYLTHFAHSYTCFPSHAPSIAEGLSCALWWGSWSRPELAVSGMRRPCFSSQRPSCRRLGTHAWHNSRPDQNVVKIKTFGATTGEGLQQCLVFVLCFSCGRSPPALWGHRYIYPCFAPGKAIALRK